MSAILESLGGVKVAPMEEKDGTWVSSGYLEDEKYSECLPETGFLKRHTRAMAPTLDRYSADRPLEWAMPTGH